jgi:hypothetical protein
MKLSISAGADNRVISSSWENKMQTRPEAYIFKLNKKNKSEPPVRTI